LPHPAAGQHRGGHELWRSPERLRGALDQRRLDFGDYNYASATGPAVATVWTDTRDGAPSADDLRRAGLRL
jgi:hypothetical protein